MGGSRSGGGGEARDGGGMRVVALLDLGSDIEGGEACDGFLCGELKVLLQEDAAWQVGRMRTHI